MKKTLFPILLFTILVLPCAASMQNNDDDDNDNDNAQQYNQNQQQIDDVVLAQQIENDEMNQQPQSTSTSSSSHSCKRSCSQDQEEKTFVQSNHKKRRLGNSNYNNLTSDDNDVLAQQYIEQNEQEEAELIKRIQDYEAENCDENDYDDFPSAKELEEWKELEIKEQLQKVCDEVKRRSIIEVHQERLRENAVKNSNILLPNKLITTPTINRENLLSYADHCEFLRTMYDFYLNAGGTSHDFEIKVDGEFRRYCNLLSQENFELLKAVLEWITDECRNGFSDAEVSENLYKAGLTKLNFEEWLSLYEIAQYLGDSITLNALKKKDLFLMSLQNYPYFHLRLSGLTDNNLKVIIEKCPVIKQLDISGFNQLTIFGFHFIAKVCGSSLTHLNCEHNHITDLGLKAIAEGCFNLIKLNLSRCALITDSGLQNIAVNCKKLDELNLQDCERITDQAIQKLHGQLPHLTITTPDGTIIEGIERH